MAGQLRKARDRCRSMSRNELEQHQVARINALVNQLSSNRFYADKLAHIAAPISSISELADWPLTTKQELLEATDRDATANLTFPPSDYTRIHRTSGTKSHPLLVSDSNTDWNWWMEVWQYVLDAANIDCDDRAFMAFSFGPFIGFWSAYDALIHRGATVIPSGGLSTLARLDLINDVAATVVCCTPTYALRMADAATADGRDLSRNSVRSLIVAGEPGGSLPAVRSKIERAWGASVLDHSGATEVGPWGVGTADGGGLHVIESEFVAEYLPHENEMGAVELVLTNLGRVGWPVIRYRTGDLVIPQIPESGFVTLDGGVVARTDEMIVVRGVNVFPSAIEDVLREFSEVEEFRIVVFREREMDALRIELDGQSANPEKVAESIQRRLGLRVDVVGLPKDSLPRFEAKSKRFVDERSQA